MSDFSMGPDVQRCLYLTDGTPYHCMQCPETISALEYDGMVTGLGNVTSALAVSDTQNVGCYYVVNYHCTIGKIFPYGPGYTFLAPPEIPTVNNG